MLTLLPRAQGNLVASKGSIYFRRIVTFNLGRLLSLKQQPQRCEQMEFGHILGAIVLLSI